MNFKKKALTMMLAFVMVLGVIAPGFARAAEEVPAHKTKVVVTKLKLEDLQGFPKEADNKPDGYDGRQITNLAKWFGSQPEKMEGIAFVIYKIEDSGQANLYTAEDGTKVWLTNSEGEISVVLPDGTYRFEEDRAQSTYVGKNGETVAEQSAVPFTITLPMQHVDGSTFSENDPLYVYPKNTEAGKPDNEKTLDETAQPPVNDDKSVKLGDKVPYKVTTTVKAGSTYNRLAWSDRMSKGLTFNEDVELVSAPDLGLVITEDYTITNLDNGFVLNLTDSGLKKLAQKTAPKVEAEKLAEQGFKVKGQGEPISGENLPVTFTLKYSATVNADAVVESALENTNTLHYGNNPGYEPEPGDNNPTPQTGVKEIKVDKSFAETVSTGTPLEWPADLTVNLTLKVYDPTTNTWGDAGQTATLNAQTTSHTFANLNETKTYKVVEEVLPGWVPNYQVQADGSLKIVNKKNPNPNPITPEPVTVRHGGAKFKKIDPSITKGENGLKDALFLVTNQAGEYLFAKAEATKAQEYATYLEKEKAYKDALDAYNALTKEQQTPEEYAKVTTAKQARDEAHKLSKSVWEFKAADSPEAAATAVAYQLISGETGNFEITGLNYGTYNLVELVAPNGYAKLTAPKPFTVSATSYSTQDGVINVENKKVTIPQTGGMGTVIFTVVGITLMAGAAVLLMKNNRKEEVNK